MDTLSPGHAQKMREDFVRLVTERILPTDLISKVMVLTQGALWKHRMIRDNNIKKSDPLQSTTPSSAIESRILTHLVGLHQSLLEIGIVELAEAPPEDASDLAQRITAVFRRTLPALRIASKWLRANFKYVTQSQYSKHKPDSRGAQVLLSAGDASAFWAAYSQVYHTLSRLFPAERLPHMNSPLEEDLEMRGFLPLKGLTIGEAM
jgi:hypothetical protein